jgi:hypothetical protein
MMQDIAIAESSNLKAVRYDDDEMKLYIAFRSGSEYVYDGVPETTVAGLSRAASSGQYFQTFIRNIYQGTMV